MSLTDPGPKPNVFDIEKETLANENYRAVVWTGKYLQVTLMSIPAGGDIGLEVHPETDQFLRVEAGEGLCQMGDAEDDLDFEEKIGDDWSIQVPAGKWHNITNTGDEPLKLYSVYAPVHHAQGIVQATAEQAEEDEESGKDEPPSWTVQP
ncbi:MAG TPA: cupin domain-containing protein [Tessaracoccus flavescens]|uniref:Cupin domain-containing protein n=1 Tax=Tessaracoccus flavescens TaxID=399497 RepID=A0A921EQM0_9ACTN|nr:cupin domain-containing protein [Tessaracoccus flavescens]